MFLQQDQFSRTHYWKWLCNLLKWEKLKFSIPQSAWQLDLQRECYLLISKQSKYLLVRNSKNLFHILNGLLICLSWLIKHKFLRHTRLQCGFLLLDSLLHFLCSDIVFSLYINSINALGHPAEATMIMKVCQKKFLH